MKFYDQFWCSSGGCTNQCLRVMKLIVILLTASLLQVSAGTFAQKVTIETKNTSLLKVFDEISKQTGYDFFYNMRLIKQGEPVSINVKNADLNEVLKICFLNQPFTYTIKEKAIIIKKPAINLLDSRLEDFLKATYVTGKVVDEEGKGLPGATVKVKGTTKSVATDLNGQFKLTGIDENSILIISFLGYNTLEVQADGTKEMVISLVVQPGSLNEVVVVGYGTQKKSDLTGSVVSLGSEDFTEGPNTNALQLLNGRAAGVSISQTSSAPGAPTKIQIRGAGSINSSNQALVVIDGLPGVDPSSISPDDIKSIEILKDASSAAIYGTRAANGVVLITTKNGLKGDPVVNFSTSLGRQSVAKKLDVLNGKEYMETLNAIRIDGGQAPIYTQSQIDNIGTGTYWQDEVFSSTAPVQNHQLSISGGGEKNDYYAGLNYYKQDGLIKNSDFNKINFRTNLNFQAKDFLRFKVNMNFTRAVQNSILQTDGVNEGAGALNSAIQFDPTLPATLDTNGKYYANPSIALDNPLALVNGILSDDRGNNLYGTFTTEVEPLKNLIGTVRLGGSLSSSLGSFYRDRTTIQGLASGGAGSKTGSDYSQWLAEFLVKYETKFGSDHNFSVLAGTTFEEFLSQGLGASSRGFLSDVTYSHLLQSGDNDKGDGVSSFKDRNRLNGIIGRVNYNYKDKYLLTASFRNDGTSRFSDSHKYAFFPSGALAWRISNEPFFKKASTIVNNLKLRLSYGVLGNQGIGNYQTIQTLVAGGSAVFGNTISPGVVPARIPNRDLKWETTDEYNAGIDFGIFNDRISGSIDYYSRDTKDQLFSKPLPSVVGFSSILINAGSVRNSGWDFLLNTVNVSREKFNWASSLNFSVLKNKVLSLPPSIPQIITGTTGGFISNYLIVQEGSPIRSFYGYETAGIFRSSDEVTGSAQPNAKPGQIRFKDQNNDNKIDATDRVVLGDPFPDFTAGINNRFTFKGFSLDLFFQWVKNVQTLDANVLESFYPTNEYRNRIAKYYQERWTPQNPDARYPSGVNPSAYGGANSINSYTIQDASFIRFKTFNLGYSIPLAKNKLISNAKLFLAADNVYTFTKYEGLDPDASNTGSESVAKVNYNSYPLNRTIRLGFNITF